MQFRTWDSRWILTRVITPWRTWSCLDVDFISFRPNVEINYQQVHRGNCHDPGRPKVHTAADGGDFPGCHCLMVKLDYPSPFCCKIVLRALKASVSGDYIWQSFIIFIISSLLPWLSPLSGSTQSCWRGRGWPWPRRWMLWLNAEALASMWVLWHHLRLPELCQGGCWQWGLASKHFKRDASAEQNPQSDQEEPGEEGDGANRGGGRGLGQLQQVKKSDFNHQGF